MKFDRDIFRANLNNFNERALKIIPPLNDPLILDIGCGTGVPTLTLAKLIRGHIIAIDVDKVALEKLAKKSRDSDLAEFIEIQNISMKKMKFDPVSFDLIWAEGCIAKIGFNKGLMEWKKLLKPKSYMVIHENIKNMSTKMDTISLCGYRLIHYFILDEITWWKKFYGPMERVIKRFILSDPDWNDPDVSAALKEINEYKRDPKSCASVFFVMQLL